MKRIALCCSNARTLSKLSPLLSARGYVVTEVQDETLDHSLEHCDLIWTELEWILARKELASRISSPEWKLPTIVLVRGNADLSDAKAHRVLQARRVYRAGYPVILHTLSAVIDHYSSGGKKHPNKDVRIQPLNLTASEKAALLAFLDTLTDPTFLSDPRFSDPFE